MRLALLAIVIVVSSLAAYSELLDETHPNVGHMAATPYNMPRVNAALFGSRQDRGRRPPAFFVQSALTHR
jgi:hypothetical protein